MSITQTSPNFAAFGKTEIECINTILGRMSKLVEAGGAKFDRLTAFMDLAAVHYHTPLDFARMAAADDGNLMHDVFGIGQHINRATGALEDCFCPRYASQCREFEYERQAGGTW